MPHKVRRISIRLQRQVLSLALSMAGPRLQHNGQCLVRIFQTGGIPHQAGYGPMKLAEQLLADRSLAVERLLMPPKAVEPHQRAGHVDKGDPFFTGDLQRGGRAIGAAPRATRIACIGRN